VDRVEFAVDGPSLNSCSVADGAAALLLSFFADLLAHRHSTPKLSMTPCQKYWHSSRTPRAARSFACGSNSVLVCMECRVVPEDALAASPALLPSSSLVVLFEVPQWDRSQRSWVRRTKAGVITVGRSAAWNSEANKRKRQISQKEKSDERYAKGRAAFLRGDADAPPRRFLAARTWTLFSLLDCLDHLV
jgi:hypothetical protein